MLFRISCLLFFLFLIGCQQKKNESGLYRFHDPKTDYYGFMDANGKTIIPAQYMGVDNGIAGDQEKPKIYFVKRPYEFVSKNNKKFAIDKQGNKLFRMYWFDNGPDYFEEGLARFIDLNNPKVGFINKEGKILINADYDWATPFKNQQALVCNECKAVPIRPIKFVAATGEQIYEYKEVQGGKWGAIDKSGQLIIPLKYDSRKQVETALEEKGIKS